MGEKMKLQFRVVAESGEMTGISGESLDRWGEMGQIVH
jgi:hypothetical protein